MDNQQRFFEDSTPANEETVLNKSEDQGSSNNAQPQSKKPFAPISSNNGPNLLAIPADFPIHQNLTVAEIPAQRIESRTRNLHETDSQNRPPNPTTQHSRIMWMVKGARRSLRTGDALEIQIGIIIGELVGTHNLSAEARPGVDMLVKQWVGCKKNENAEIQAQSFYARLGNLHNGQHDEEFVKFLKTIDMSLGKRW